MCSKHILEFDTAQGASTSLSLTRYFSIWQLLQVDSRTTSLNHTKPSKPYADILGFFKETKSNLIRLHFNIRIRITNYEAVIEFPHMLSHYVDEVTIQDVDCLES